ncbi:MAG: DUF4332 domain-containing protein [Thiotrichales bacterium]
MLYLITQIVLCLALAALLGFLIGWWLHAVIRRDREAPLRHERDDLAEQVATLRQARDAAVAQHRELEHERDAMRQQILSFAAITPEPTPRNHAAINPRVDVASAELIDEAQATGPDTTRWEQKTRTISNVAEFDVTEFESLNSTPSVEPEPQPIAATPGTAETTAHAIEHIDGVGKGYGKRLRALGIGTTDELLARCHSGDDRNQIAEHLGLDEFVVRKWSAMADFMRIPGVTGQIAGLMDRAGVTSLGELAARHAHPLATRMAELAAQEAWETRPPSTGEVRAWIEIAKHLIRP